MDVLWAQHFLPFSKTKESPTAVQKLTSSQFHNSNRTELTSNLYGGGNKTNTHTISLCDSKLEGTELSLAHLSAPIVLYEFCFYLCYIAT